MANDDDTIPAAPRRAPPFFLAERFDDVHFLGEGGMGTVYRAVDRALGRRVALKLLKPGDPELGSRFLTEARAQAQVDHENVCRVYEAGELYGQPFIAMQYIEGAPLSDAAEGLTIEQRVRLLQRIALAVHEAHRHGIIHRDIKPANILVERQPGGALKPYILDFGLARKVGERGMTRTGVVVGTLTYMPPEQARGDWQRVDRRSDVFALGATLYDVIAGRPPFVAEQPMRLLMMATYEDAPRLGKVKPGVPPALETIVMKCLEREPERRYDSAKALADDLQRYLDGARIEARPPSAGRRLGRAARRHKAATAALGALLAGALALGGVWLRAERRAEEQARVAHDLGAGVKEMELFLRAAHAMPLHDVERERDVVRRRLSDLTRLLGAAGDAGVGPAEMALGQGHLALGDPAAAREHLERALAAGYAPPELHAALGRALGELFRRALADTKRITNEAERREKVAALEGELRDPALAHLRAAGGAAIEVPEYAEGLVALYEGRNEEAAAKAREAFAKAPWMYEAKKLEGDALYAEGSKYRHDAAFDHEKMSSYFEPAAQAYSIAADIGRSDPEVHLAACDLGEKVGWAAWNKGLPCRAAFEAADAACRRAIEASSRDGRALVQRALVLTGLGFSERDEPTDGTAAVLEDAVDAAEAGVLARPSDLMARYAVARALSFRSQVAYNLGREASMDAAIEAYEDVLGLDPRFTWAVSELGDAYAFQASMEQRRGQDAAVWVDAALRRYEEAMALDPKLSLAAGGRLNVLTAQIEARLERGQSVDRPLQALRVAADELETGGFGPWLSAYWKARALRLSAQRDLAMDRDPGPALGSALATIRAFAGDVPGDAWFLQQIAWCHLLGATWALRRGDDAAPLLSRAEEAAGRARELGAAVEELSAQIALARAREPRRDVKAQEASVAAALAYLAPLLARPGADPELFALAAEALARRAELRRKNGDPPGADVEEGLAMTDRALARNPTLARALLARGYLHLTTTRAAGAAGARAEAARLAKEAFEAAFRDNPRLARAHGDVLKETEPFLR